jgi:hypothetical protein
MKYFLISILAALSAATANAASLADNNIFQFELNHGDISNFYRRQAGTVLIKERESAKKCVYDFSKQGGAIGTLNLLDEVGKPCVLPNKAVVWNVYIDTVTAPTSGGGATIAISSGQVAADIKAATAFGSYSGLVAGIPVGNAATAFKLTADQKPTLTIATAALTAGKLNVQIIYQISE